MQDWLQKSEDRQVWQAFQQGDPAAFQQLYNRYYPLLYRYGRRFTPDTDLIKDAIHDLFLKLYNQRLATGDVQTPAAYLLRAFRNVLLNQLKRKSRINIFSSPEEYTFEMDACIEDAIVQEQLSAEQRDQLRQAMNRLSKRQKEAIYLKFYSDLGYQEVAAIMSLRYQSVVNLIHEAIKVLGKHIILTGLLLFLQHS